jgi:hypothetical protein
MSAATSDAVEDGMSRTDLLLLGLALAFAALVIGGRVEPYGLFHDELYYWAGAQRLGLGYVDHPPLAPWVLRGSTALLGDGRLGFGLVPALCAAGTLLLTGLMARRLGAGRFGQLLAGLCVATAPIFLVFGSFFSVNALEILLWTLACFLLVELIRTGNERLWLGIGLVAGLGLLNKHTFALLAAGLAVGIAATPLRSQLRSRWPWLGAAVALLVALPNLYWNWLNDWPSLAFYRSRPAVDLPASLVEAFVLQIVGMNPATVFVWVAGLLFLLLSREARPHRAFGVAFLALFAVMLFSGLRRVDRIAGIFPIALAAGAAFWDRWRGRGRSVVRFGLPALILGFGALALPASLPILPPETEARYLAALGDAPDIETSDVGRELPLYLLGRLEWERMADEVASAFESLPAEERERAVILAPHWVFASVVEYYGRDRGLPPVVSPHNAYWFWREEAAGRDVALSVAIGPEVLSQSFAETRALGVSRCEPCPGFRRDLPIFVSTGPIRPIEELLAEWRHFSIEAAPALLR